MEVDWLITTPGSARWAIFLGLERDLEVAMIELNIKASVAIRIAICKKCRERERALSSIFVRRGFSAAPVYVTYRRQKLCHVVFRAIAEETARMEKSFWRFVAGPTETYF